MTRRRLPVIAMPARTAATNAGALLWMSVVSGACRDVSGFSTHGDSFSGPAVEARFVRAGIDAGTALCLTLDADQFESAPGTLSTSDGLFQRAPLRPIPQIWRDSLSTLSFGEGRIKNLLYVVTATRPFADDSGTDAWAVVSLMQSGDIEVRLLHGTAAGGDAASPAGNAPEGLFAIFGLTRQKGRCSF